MRHATLPAGELDYIKQFNRFEEEDERRKEEESKAVHEMTSPVRIDDRAHRQKLTEISPRNGRRPVDTRNIRFRLRPRNSELLSLHNDCEVQNRMHDRKVTNIGDDGSHNSKYDDKEQYLRYRTTRPRYNCLTSSSIINRQQDPGVEEENHPRRNDEAALNLSHGTSINRHTYNISHGDQKNSPNDLYRTSWGSRDTVSVPSQFRAKKPMNSFLRQSKLFVTQRLTYACGICMRSFSNHSNLKRHRLLHSTKRPFKCDMCEKQ